MTASAAAEGQSRKQPKVTRQRLVDAAFREIHRNGFRAASVDAMLAKTGVTKGALYHHFPNKRDLGLAVVDEVIAGFIERNWAEVFTSDDPITAMIELLNESMRTAKPEMLQFGCPLNNLAQEMAPIDDDFRGHLADIQRDWRERLSQALARGQQMGTVRQDCDPESTAALMIAMNQGTIGTAKNELSPKLIMQCVTASKAYLETLRPVRAASKTTGAI